MAYGYNYSQGGYPGSRYGSLYKDYPDNPVDKIGPALDTTQPRPSYQTAAQGGQTSITRPPEQTTPTTTATPGITSPELAGLAHSIQTPVTTTNPATPTAQAPVTPGYLQPIQEAIPGLVNPITTPLGMDPAARQAMLNQYTRASQRGTNLAAEQMREKMAAATGGMVAPGESGLADTALANIYRGGAGDIAKYAGGLAAEEALAAPGLAQGLAGLNLNRVLAAGNLGQMLSQQELAGQQFDYGKQMDALNLLMSLYGAEQGYQQNQWSPYYQGIVGAYGG